MTKQDFIDIIDNMTVEELKELIELLRQRLLNETKPNEVHDDNEV